MDAFPPWQTVYAHFREFTTSGVRQATRHPMESHGGLEVSLNLLPLMMERLTLIRPTFRGR